MKNEITSPTPAAMMSTKEVAQLTGKTLGNIHADVWTLIFQLYGIGKDDWNFNHHKKQPVEILDGAIAKIDSRGYVSELLLNRRHTEILITGYDVVRRAAVIDRWFTLESKTQQPVDAMRMLSDPATLRGLLMNYSEDNQRLAGENIALTATVGSLEKHFTKGMTIPAFCKGLNGVNVSKMMWWAFGREWVYNEQRDPEKDPRWRVASYARDKYLTEDKTQVTPHGMETFTRFSPVLLEGGCHRIYQLYMKGELPMKKTWNGEFSHDKAIYTPEADRAKA
ncbi:ORF6N domain-containing protein [Pantoea sp. LMR881]|uniref:ORF6N domain-containing protein n=1 Tax=Pantoea sp. LMR881 TaxID=3014336 RepID=UPI0022AF76D3|nr:ORF6N domain-containing protein [Pantoea sp. LMR881]MCZ4058191.1 ORF6N domain-containing protein [Pantoea sp. LMR881]